MKLSKIVFVCLALFMLCLSVSLVYTLFSNFIFVIAYSVFAVFVSFGILYRSTCNCSLLKDKYCFKLLFYVVVTFVSLAFIVCVFLVLCALVLICVDVDSPESIFHRVLDFSQVLCMPFLFIALESAFVMIVKDAKICPKM